MQLKQIKKQVEEVLKEHPQTRNSDRFLIMVVAYTYYPLCGGFFLKNNKKTWGINLNDPDAPSPESIRRWRQKVQSEGKYLPTNPAIAKQRKLNIAEVQIELGYSSK